jgi:cation diffusion facilitator CzcD-associated flavoprotein CzcO
VLATAFGKEHDEPMAPSAMPSTVNGQNGIAADYPYPPATVEGEYRVLNQYHSKPTKLRVACCGAGASGLCLAYKMEKMLAPGSFELTLFEKNPQFGGTWYENTYPGVACDIPAHDYVFTWDPKPDWTQFFAAGAEIQGYFEGFAERHGSKKYMKLNSKIVETRWSDEEGVWHM